MTTSDYPREHSSQRSIISEKQLSSNAPNFPGEREAGKKWERRGGNENKSSRAYLIIQRATGSEIIKHAPSNFKLHLILITGLLFARHPAIFYIPPGIYNSRPTIAARSAPVLKFIRWIIRGGVIREDARAPLGKCRGASDATGTGSETELENKPRNTPERSGRTEPTAQLQAKLRRAIFRGACITSRLK